MYDLSVALIGMSAGPDGQLWSRATLTSPWQKIPTNGALPGGDYRSITVMPDGRILCLNAQGYLFTRKTLTSQWEPVLTSNGLPGGDHGSIAVMKNGNILGVGSNRNLFTCETLTSPWVEKPSSGLPSGDRGSITVMQDGTILGMGVSSQSIKLYTRATLNDSWQEVQNNNSLLTTRSAWERFRITVLKDGTILCLACHNNYLWQRSTLNSEWKEISNGSPTQPFMGVVGIASGEGVAIAELSSEGSTFSTGLDLQIKLSKELEKLKRLEAKETLLNELIGRVLNNKSTSQSTDMKELQEYIQNSKKREDILKEGSAINKSWQDTKIAVSAAKASADEAERSSQEASNLYSDTPEATSASDAAKDARRYADLAEQSLAKIEDSVKKQGFTIEDLTSGFTTLFLKENEIAKNPDPGNSGTRNAISQSSNNAGETQVSSAPGLNSTAGSPVSQPKTTIEKLEEIKEIAQEARDQAEGHRGHVVEKQREVQKYLEDAKRIYRNWDSIRILFGFDKPSSEAPTETISSSSLVSKTSAEASNWAAVKGLFSIKDSPSTNNSSSNQ